MKKSLAVLNAIFIIALLFSAYALYTAVEPIVTGKVSIEMQDQDDIEWEFSNDTIEAHTWVDIINGGKYEIRDTHLHIWIIYEEMGMTILDMKKDIPPVSPGSTHRENIDAYLNLSQFPDEIKNELWRNYANFTIYAEITAYFMNRGGEILVNYHNTILWEPLLKHVHVDAENSTIHYDSSTGNMSIYVPYEVSTSSLLSGSADALVQIYNGSKVLSSCQEKIELGRDHYGTLVFEISSSDTYYLMTHSMPLPVVATVEYSWMFMEVNETYDWGAPFDDLYIGEIQNEANRITVSYSFTNDYVRDMDLTINAVVYDSAGNVIGSKDYHYIAYMGSRVDRQISVDVSAYPDHALITVTENISGWHYTIRRDA